MNIFYVDSNPQLAAQSLVDIHVNKMICESAQMLQNCYSRQMLRLAPKTATGSVRAHSYWNHPCSKWVRESKENFEWLLSHALHLLREREYRTGKGHATSDFIHWCVLNKPDRFYPDLPFTKPALAIKIYPDLGDPVITYRNYYNQDKKHLFRWTKRKPPIWITI